jgi:hypothetical protein
MMFQADKFEKHTQHTATSDKKRWGWEGSWICYRWTSRGGYVWLSASILCLRKLALHGSVLLSNSASASAIERGGRCIHLLLCRVHLRDWRRRRRHPRSLGLHLLDRKWLIHLSANGIALWPLRRH